MANIFSDIGWDVRWVGNENGFAGETSWATFTPVPAKGESKAFPGNLDHEQNPFGTRNGNSWVPAECDVPLRKGWFWHPEQKDQVKTPVQLFDIYLKSVGRGGALDIGIAPNTKGQLADEDIASLQGFGEIVQKTFTNNLAQDARFNASDTRGKDFELNKLTDDNKLTYWATHDEIKNATINLEWDENQTIDFIRLREYIQLGQRIEKVSIESFESGNWDKVGEATSIGAARIISLNKTVHSRKLRVMIEAPTCITLAELGCYKKYKP
jgi:alpha-L-fucosidase